MVIGLTPLPEASSTHTKPLACIIAAVATLEILKKSLTNKTTYDANSPNILQHQNWKHRTNGKAVEEGAKTVPSVEVILTYHAIPQKLQSANAIIIGVPTYNHHMTLDSQNLLEKQQKATSH